MPSGVVHPELGALVRITLDNPSFVKNDPNLAGELGIGVPKPIAGWAVLDTGASISCVTVDTAEALGLLTVDAVSFCGVRAGHLPADPAREHTRLRYGLLRLVGVARTFAVRLAEVRPLGNHVDQPVIALLGRDVLQFAELGWDGPSAAFDLNFRPAADAVVKEG